eukprot:272981_1
MVDCRAIDQNMDALGINNHWNRYYLHWRTHMISLHSEVDRSFTWYRLNCMERFRYGEAMDYDDENGNTMQIHKVGNVQFLKVIEFIFDHDKNHKNHKKQCYLEFKDVENQILLFVKKTRGYLSDEGQWLSFEKDE